MVVGSFLDFQWLQCVSVLYGPILIHFNFIRHVSYKTLFFKWVVHIVSCPITKWLRKGILSIYTQKFVTEYMLGRIMCRIHIASGSFVVSFLNSIRMFSSRMSGPQDTKYHKYIHFKTHLGCQSGLRLRKHSDVQTSNFSIL